MDRLDGRYRSYPIFEKSASTYSRRSKSNMRNEALLEVLGESLALATVDLQRTLQTFHKFRSHVNKVVNNMDSVEKHFQKKIEERDENVYPTVRTFQKGLFRASTKRSLSSFALIRVLVLLMENWERKYPYRQFPRYTFKRLATNRKPHVGHIISV